MSNADLKTSLRHTHAYIGAYGVDLLRNIERSFRDALDEVHDDGQNAPQQDEKEFEVNFDEPQSVPLASIDLKRTAKSDPKPEPGSKPEPERIRLSALRQQEKQQDPSDRSRDASDVAADEIECMPAWHLYLPAVVATCVSLSVLLHWWLA